MSSVEPAQDRAPVMEVDAGGFAAGEIEAEPAFPRQTEELAGQRAERSAVGDDDRRRNRRRGAQIGQKSVGAGAHLAWRLAAGRREVERRRGPGVEGGLTDVVEAASFPVAEVDFLEARVELRRTEGFGEQARTAQRAGIEGKGFRQQRTQPGRDGVDRFGKAEVGLAVADSRLDGRPGMTDQIEFQAARIPQ